MSTATIAPRTATPTSMPYVPPEAKEGQSVVFFPSGSHIDKPMLGQLWSCGARAHRVLTFGPGGGVKDSVYHIDDPIVTANPNFAKKGCWDFTEEQKQRNSVIARMTDIEQRLLALEETLNQNKELAARVESLEVSKGSGKSATDLVKRVTALEEAMTK